MKNSRKIFIISTSIALIVISLLFYLHFSGTGLDNQSQHDPTSTSNREYLWKISTTVEISGTPICDDQHIIFASKAGYIYCTNPENGKLIWKKSLKVPIINALSIDTNGNVYVVASSKQLFCLDKAGEIKWKIALDGVPRTTPIESKGVVYIGTEEGFVYAIDTATQKIAWKTDIKLPIFSSAVFNHTGTQVLVPTKNYYLVAVDTSGTIAWKFKANGVIFSSPAVTKTGDIYLTSMDHHIYKLSSQGTQKWTYKCKRWVSSSPALDENENVYFGSYDQHFYSLDSKGNERWQYKGKGSFNAHPVIDSNSTVYTGDSSGTIYAFTPEGKVLWTHKTADIIQSGLTIYSPGKILIAGSLDSFLYAFKIDGTLSRTAIWPKYLGNQRNTGSFMSFQESSSPK